MKNPAFWLILALPLFVTDVHQATSIMEEVVVTATRTEKVLKDNPYSVSLITNEQIEIQPADQIADYLKDLPGISVTDAGQAGFKRIRIRGEEARRMAFLVDGQEFMDHREVGVPLLVDPLSIQRIEVIRGPASVLYGPKAMGGVINVITDTDIPESFSLNLSTTYDSSTDGSQYALGISAATGDWQWRISAIENDQKERDTAGGEIENTAYENDGASFTVKRITDNNKLTFGYEDFNASADVYVEPEVRFSFPFVDFRIEAPQRDREKYRIAWEQSTEGLFETVKIDGYHQVSDREFNTFPSVQAFFFLPRKDTSIYTTSQLISDAINIQTNWNTGDSHQLITGIQFLKDRVEQYRLREVYLDGTLTETENHEDKSHNRTFAFYIQNDWSINEDWSLLAGARLYQVEGKIDKSSRFADSMKFDDKQSIASISAVYRASKSITYRLTYSQGYIYPSLLNLSIGAFAGPRYVNPDPDLKPEESDTFEAGFRFTNTQWDIDGTVFTSTAKNYIDHEFCLASDPCLTLADKIYKNTGDSDAHGIELSINYSSKYLDVYNNLTWIKRKKAYEGVDSYKSGIPRLTSRLGVTWSTNLSDYPFLVDVYSRYESNADEIRTAGGGFVVEEHEGWGTLNTDLNLQIGSKYSITASLLNLTDRKYSSATENLYAPGRHIQIKLSGKF